MWAMNKPLKIIIELSEWVGIVSIVALLILEIHYHLNPSSAIVKRVSVWLIISSAIFILIVPLFLLRKLPTILRIHVLFVPGLVLLFWSASLAIRNFVLFGIDFRYLLGWSATGSLVVWIVLKITYAIRRKRMEDTVGKRDNKVSRTM